MLENTAPAVLSVRVSSNERILLELAAEQSRTTLSDFIRRKALEAAESDVIEQRSFVISAADWDKFESWAYSPAREVPALRKLAASRPAWQE